MDRQMPRPQDEFTPDLHSEEFAGRNYGDEGPDTTTGTPASEYKDLHGRLSRFTTDELAALPVVEEGTRLEQGKTYIDLNDLERGEFTGMANESAGPKNRYVAKDAVDYDTWNRLRGREELASGD